MPEIVYTHEGALSEEALLAAGRVLAYKGSLPLPNDSRETFRIITNSVVIPRAVTEKLSQFGGKFSLSQTRRGLSNAHIFSSKASFFDGKERICYLQYSEGTLFVQEYGGRRGANYSALYPELVRKLEERGFAASEYGVYHIPSERAEDLLEALEQVELARREGRLELQSSGKLDSIAFAYGRRYYYQVYWHPLGAADEGVSQPCAGHTELIAQLETGIRDLAECSLRGQDRAQLEEIRQAVAALQTRLADLDEMCRNGLNSLDLAKKLGLTR